MIHDFVKSRSITSKPWTLVRFLPHFNKLLHSNICQNLRGKLGKLMTSHLQQKNIWIRSKWDALVRFFRGINEDIHILCAVFATYNRKWSAAFRFDNLKNTNCAVGVKVSNLSSKLRISKVSINPGNVNTIPKHFRSENSCDYNCFLFFEIWFAQICRLLIKAFRNFFEVKAHNFREKIRSTLHTLLSRMSFVIMKTIIEVECDISYIIQI